MKKYQGKGGMKKLLLLLFCVLQSTYCQEYGWVPTDHLAARYSFNGNAGNAADSSLSITMSQCALTDDNNGYEYCACRFNGVNSYISVDSPSKTDSCFSAFSISVYVCPFYFPAVVFSKMHGECSQVSFGLSLTSDSVKLTLPGTTVCFPVITSLADSQWYHIVFTWDGDSIKAYCNGGQLGAALYLHAFQSGQGMLYVGRNPVTGEFFNGSIDELRIYTRAIDKYEVKALQYFQDSISSYIPPKMHLTISLLLEGFYNPVADTMTSDSVSLFLYGNQPPYNTIDSSQVLLNLHGRGTCTFNAAKSGSYFVAVRHRNHLETWSAAPWGMNRGDTLTVDFSSDSTTVYNGNVTRIGNRWLIYAGDINQDGLIDNNDMQLLLLAAASYKPGYIAEDLNGDGMVDFSDIAICDNNSYNLVRAVGPKNTPPRNVKLPAIRMNKTNNKPASEGEKK